MKKQIYMAFAACMVATAVYAEQVQFSATPKSVQNTVNQNLSGGVVKSIDKKVKDGRTVYDVAIRREGKDQQIRVDADGKLMRADSSAAVNITTDKNDGKILGVVPNPNRSDDGLNAEARVGDNKVKIEGDVDSKDRGVTEDIFDKNDGKLGNVLPAPGRKDRDLNAETRVEIDRDDAQVKVETDSGRRKIFHKGDGKLLGFIPWKKQERKVEVEMKTDGESTSIGAPAGPAHGQSENNQ